MVFSLLGPQGGGAYFSDSFEGWGGGEGLLERGGLFIFL